MLGGAALGVALLESSWGREQLRATVQDAVNAQIPGRLTVSAFDDIAILSSPTSPAVRVRDVRFADPAGNEVIRVSRAVIRFDPLALLDRKVRINDADIDGGVVKIESSGKGRTRIEDAFTSPDTVIGPSAMDIELDDLHVKDMELAIAAGKTRVTVEQIEGTIGVSRAGGAHGVSVTLADLAGSVSRPSLLGMRLELESVDGAIEGKRREVIHLDYRAKFAGGGLEGTVRYVPTDEKPVHLRIKASGAAATLLGGLGDVRSAFGGSVDVQLE